MQPHQREVPKILLFGAQVRAQPKVVDLPIDPMRLLVMTDAREGERREKIDELWKIHVDEISP